MNRAGKFSGRILIKMGKQKYFKDFSGLRSNRILLRKLSLEDVNDIFEFTSLEDTSQGLSWDPHQDINRTREFLQSILDKYKNNLPSQWAIELIDRKKVIGIGGFISYFEEHHKGEIAYVLSPHCQGKGYMTEALKMVFQFGFNEMKLNRIEAKCETDNFASEKVMQKLGMRFEGCLFDYLFRKGKARSYKFYSILKKDFESNEIK